tara:strand:+ start:1983 stop:2273 length:291 start_codon:yes stop_codon:yes gene_type:complete
MTEEQTDKTPEPVDEPQPQPAPVDEKQTEGLVDEALNAADRIEKANAEYKALVERQERVLVETKLGGKAAAGSVPEKPKEETATEYAKRVMRGEII